MLSHLIIFPYSGCAHMHHIGAAVGVSGVAAVAAGVISSRPDTSSGSTNVVQKETVVLIRCLQNLSL